MYQIYVRSFGDANCDGVGDLEGIISKLDYLRDLGIDAFWLTPCYPSPQADHGYDVADYLNIHSEYGDLETFDRLVREANARNIRVLMDVVPNHCSDQHTWFKKALADGPGSEAREWFWFREGKGDNGELPPNNWQAWFGGSAWTRVTEPNGAPGQWYLHLFTPQQPDVNWTYEPLRQSFDDMLRFWYARGVDGFRIDAPAVVGKAPGLPDAPPPTPGSAVTEIAYQNPHIQHRPEVHEMFARWRSVTDQFERDNPGRSLVFIGETYAPSLDVVASYVGDRELHTTFFFDLMLANWEAFRWTPMLESVADRFARNVRFALTLNNHDMQRSVSRYGHTDSHLPSSFTFNNLRNSLEPVDLNLGTRRARAATLLLLGLPNPIFLYTGEELGLPEVLDIPEASLQDPIWERSNRTERGRDGCRVPLPWSSDKATNYGFSPSSTGAPAWLPQPDNWGVFAAAAQKGNEHSMLHLYQTALRARKSFVDTSALTILHLGENLIGYERDGLRCLMNFAHTAVSIADHPGAAILWSSEATPGSLPANSAVWLQT